MNPPLTTPTGNPAPAPTMSTPPTKSEEYIPNFSELPDLHTVILAEDKYDYLFHDYKNPLTWARANDRATSTRSEGTFVRARTARSQVQMLEEGGDEMIQRIAPEPEQRFAIYTWNYDQQGDLKQAPHITKQELEAWRNLEPEWKRLPVNIESMPLPVKKKLKMSHDGHIMPGFDDYTIDERREALNATGPGAFTMKEALWRIDRRERERQAKELQQSEAKVEVLQQRLAAEEVKKEKEKKEMVALQMDDGIAQKTGGTNVLDLRQKKRKLST
ncbi:uncharacterized protein J4E79_009920 [Alternaria viburni]|uniref:uncharacterized protein n=1 Tax=Alternaria viburni TaxID=566460 RepID=UPI0020C263E8|nr:uncharacterized protein J4E79_009920 [Alternaria viburni]KAI4616663.1 hypothetical protein J4E80_005938 [Alternaria sp. BMP 0032]KAI4648848.1 hypothetical protein J4E79_009920 [Alternaria viburni]